MNASDEAKKRIADYLARRSASRSDDQDHIHNYDVSLANPNGIALKASDLRDLLAEIAAKDAEIARMKEAPTAQPSPDVAALVEAISPLVAIADAFDANELDDEARKFWGQHSVNTTPHENIVLYSGRGGKEMLTLADCMKARAALARVKGGAA